MWLASISRLSVLAGVLCSFAIAARAEPPSVTSHPTNVTAAVGQLVRFFASASGAPSPSYQWLFNNAPIPGATSFTLTLSNPRVTDAGEYSMIASNSEGSVTSHVAVLTLVPPRIGAGSVDIDFFPGTSAGASVSLAAVQDDGKILIAGPSISFNNTNQNGLARLHPDGSADFSLSAPSLPGSGTQFLQALPNRKIIWHRSPGYLTRLLSNGSVDPGFATLSTVNVSVLLIQPDGSIVASASSQSGYSISRLTADGLSDFTFNGITYVAEGGSVGAYRFVAGSLPDGKIILGGDGVRRLHAHGAADFAFASSVRLINNVVTKPDGKVFVSGTFTNVGAVPRRGLAFLNEDGSLDSSFDPALGLGTIASMALQPDGKLLVLSSNRLARLNPDGSLDSGFSPGTGANNTISSILLQPDCKILVVGNFPEFDGYRRWGIVRLNNDLPTAPTITRGPLSQTVTQGANVTFTVEHTSMPPPAVQWWRNDEVLPGETNAWLRFVAEASEEYRVVLSNALGSVTSAAATLTVTAAPANPGHIDIEFGGRSGADSTVRTMAYQSNGKLIIAGWFREVDGLPRPGIARLNADGSVDATFDPGTGPNGRIYALAVDANDRILVGGLFTSFSGETRGRLARLLPDGQLDPSFVIGNGIQGIDGGSVRAIATQPDGKIVVVGWFDRVQNNTRPGVARFNPDGSLDMPFVPSRGNDMESVALQPDGKIVVGGHNAVYRITPDGIVENFPSGSLPAPLFSGRAHSVVIQHDGKILVGFGPVTSSSGGIQGLYTTTLPIFRLNPNGSLDTNFNNSYGIPPPGYNIHALHLHTCGRILVAGSFIADFANPRLMYQLARLTPDGRFDPDFPQKLLDGNVYAITTDSEKRILIGGQFSKVDHAVRNGIARLHAEPYGPPVLSEQPAHQTTDAGRELVLSAGIDDCSDYQYQWQRNSTNLPGGTNATLMLANARTPDAGEYRLVISNGPHVTVSEPAQVQVIREPRHPGSADVDFFPPRDLDGRVHALALDANGNLLVGGSFTNIAGGATKHVARFNGLGLIDSTFNVYSNLSGTVYALAPQADGKILAAGVFGSSQLLARLMPDGRRDTNFSMPVGDGAAYAVAALTDGKILLAGPMTVQFLTGPSRTGIARLLPDGRLDPAFAASSVRYPLAFAQQRDRRILIGGTFTNVGQIARMRVARLLTNGPADPTFNPGTGPNGPITAVALSRDEKVYIAGNFSEVAGIDRSGICRLNDNGTVDLSFDPGPGMNAVWTLAVQPDGKVLAGGSFRYAGGLPRPGVVRFNIDGSIDTRFDPGSGVNAQVFAMAFDPTGKIYIGGNFTEYNGYPRDRLARINGDLFLVNSARSGGSFQLSFFTFFDETYVLEFADSLTNPNWTSRSSLLGDGTIRTLTDMMPGDATSGWYRVRNEE